MTRPDSVARQMANMLMRLTVRMMPAVRTEWAAAMQSESLHINNDFLAIRWAFGCLTVALRKKVKAMMTGNFRVSKWVLALEMALCFVPLSFAWFDTLFGGSGVIRLNADVIQAYFLGTPGGVAVLVTMFAMAVLGIFGPLGLLAAASHIALGRGIRNHLLGITLIAGPAVLGVIYVGGNLVIGPLSRNWFGGILLLLILPIVGALHLRHLTAQEPVQHSAA